MPHLDGSVCPPFRFKEQQRYAIAKTDDVIVAGVALNADRSITNYWPIRDSAVNWRGAVAEFDQSSCNFATESVLQAITGKGDCPL